MEERRVAESESKPASERDDNNLDQLTKRYFQDELGLAPEDIPEAAKNLLGAFGVLLRIDERLKKQPL